MASSPFLDTSVCSASPGQKPHENLGPCANSPAQLGLFMRIADLLNEHDRLTEEVVNLPPHDRDEPNACAISQELENYAGALTRVVMKDHTNDAPFVEEVACRCREAIRTNPDLAPHFGADRIRQVARSLRLAAIRATLKEVEAGRLALPEDTRPAQVKAPVKLTIPAAR